ncbi:MAG: HAD-IA family hydrolase [Hyphomicrobiaceae bacterium]
MKLVLLDCDGTLVDSQHVICAAMTSGFKAIGVAPPSREAVLSIVGLSVMEAVTALAPLDTAPELLGRLGSAYREASFALRAEPGFTEPLFEGARELVERLSAREDVVLGVATGKSRRGLDSFLEREGLREHFRTFQTADSAPSKPHPGMIEQAIRETGAEPQRTVMIGDTSFDVQMAINAGARAIGVSWGYHPPELLKDCGADFVAQHFGEIEPAIDRLIPAREAS